MAEQAPHVEWVTLAKRLVAESLGIDAEKALAAREFTRYVGGCRKLGPFLGLSPNAYDSVSRLFNRREHVPVVEQALVKKYPADLCQPFLPVVSQVEISLVLAYRAAGKGDGATRQQAELYANGIRGLTSKLP